MRYILTADWEDGIAALTERLVQELAKGQPVLWLVTGGSNIKAATAVMRAIPDKLTGNLSVTLTDERFGPVGHPDSNWQQLRDAGFDFKHSQPLPVLTGDKSLEATGATWATVLAEQFRAAGAIIGQFGMGPDGHIAGILPHSVAVNVEGLVSTYATPTYSRITTTFEAIKKCTVAYLLAFGVDRKPALQNLQADHPLAEQPAQILKTLSEAYLYNDQVGERV